MSASPCTEVCIPRTAPQRTGQRPGLLAMLRLALAARRQRARLAGLDDRALRDIGVTRDQALKEAARPVWDAPAHWRR